MVTALNGIVQRDAVHLLTDGAIYNSEGRIIDIGSKIQIFPEARMAIGWSGFDPMAAIRRGVRKHDATTAREILDVLPTILREEMAKAQRWAARHRRFPLVRWLIGSEPIEPELSLLVALWDNGPQLFVMHSDNSVHANLDPFVPLRLMASLDIIPGTERAIFGRAVNVMDPRSFDPAVDGLRLLEHQRRLPWDNGQFAVGGIAELTTISADGVQRRTLRRWNDKIGERITPELEAA